MALLGRLAGHAEGVADLRPRAALCPGVLHEVIEQFVAERLDLVFQRGRPGDACERVIVAILLDSRDQLVQVHRCQPRLDTDPMSTFD